MASDPYEKWTEEKTKLNWFTQNNLRSQTLPRYLMSRTPITPKGSPLSSPNPKEPAFSCVMLFNKLF
jgi:hypothetical protein